MESAVIIRIYHSVPSSRGSFEWKTETDVYVLLSNDASLVEPYLPLHHGLPKYYTARMPFDHGKVGERLYYGMLAEEHLGEDMKKLLDDDEKGLMSFADLRVYRDLELIGLASFLTAGNGINKFMHRPLSQMSVTRIQKADMPAPLRPFRIS